MPSFQEICTAIQGTMETALVPAQLVVVYNYDQLPEGMNDTPAMEVYVESWDTTTGSETDRNTFCPPSGIPRRRTDVLVRMDLYVRQRSQLDEDWGEAMRLANEVQDTLEVQCGCPPFGLDGIGYIRWTAQRVVFDRAQVFYTGYRFEITAGVY